MDRAKAVALLMAGLLAGCRQSPRIVVGSKNFTEQVILAEILAQHLERRLGISVDRRLNLGGTLLAHEALVSGEIDLYPEYTGTALTVILKKERSTSPAAVYEFVRAEYRKRWQLVWLPPLGFENTFAIAVRGDAARAGQLATISDAARYRSDWKLGAGYEFLRRPDGLNGLLSTYGLHLGGAPMSMDLGLLYRALESGQVDMIAANSTDGLLSALDVKVLRDDKNYFPPYQCSIVVREKTLAAQPKLQPVLEELAGKISETAMRKLNYSVDGEHRALREVAAEFLGSLK